MLVYSVCGCYISMFIFKPLQLNEKGKAGATENWLNPTETLRPAPPATARYEPWRAYLCSSGHGSSGSMGATSTWTPRSGWPWSKPGIWAPCIVPRAPETPTSEPSLAQAPACAVKAKIFAHARRLNKECIWNICFFWWVIIYICW